MKIKRSSSKKQLHKWTKLGVGLAAVTVLGGLVEPVGLADFGLTKVYAEESKSITYRVHYFLNDIKENGGLPSYTDIAPYKEGTIIQGETITEIAPQIDGYVLTKETWNSDKDVVTYDKMTAIEAWSDAEFVKSTMFFYDKVESSVVEKPVETPVVSPPAETQVVTAKVTAFKLEELVGANYKYQPMGTFSLEPVVIQLQPGETYTPPSYDGYKLVKFEYRNSVTDITPEEATISYADFTPGQEISLDYYYLNTKQVYDVLNKRYVDRDTNLSPLPPTETPTIDNTTDTANSSVDVSFQEASTRLYNLLMTASRLNPADYTAESYNKGMSHAFHQGRQNQS